MKIVLQRVTEASVTIDGIEKARISRGYVVLLGVAEDDTESEADALIEKISKLRIFPDENGKTNINIHDVKGEILVISQFTLLADCKKGNRPSFIGAASPERASGLYDYFLQTAKSYFARAVGGIFGANMQVTLTNDGPFTLVLER